MAKANGGEVRARLTLDNSKFRRNMTQSRQQMRGMGDDSEATRAQLDTIQSVARNVGIAVAGIGAAAVTTAAQFEQSMARVQAVSQTQGEEFAALEDAAREAGSTTVFSANQAADGLSYLSMAGFEAKESVEALPSVLDLAASAQIELGRSADIVSNIMTGFGLSTDETRKATDVLVQTMTSANTDLPQLGQAMKMVAPTAESLGWSIEETSTAIAKMSDAGIQGSQAGTNLRASLLSLANPVGQTKDAFDELGLNLEDTEGNMLPLPDLIEEVQGKFEGMSDKQKTANAQMLVGREAASGFLALMKSGPDDLEEYTKSLENSDGAAEQLAETQNDTLQGSFKQFQSALTDVGISLGDELMPEVKAFVDGLTDAMRWLGDVNPQILELGLKFSGGAAAAASAAAAVGKLTMALRTMQLSMGPVGWISLAAGALGGLAATTIDAKEETEELNDINLENIETMKEEQRQFDNKIERYEELRAKSEDTNEVLGNFLDLQSEIRMSGSKKEIANLKEEQKKLAEQSGYTVEELKEMAELNNNFVDNNSKVISSYSERGNAIAGNVEKLKELNKEQLESISNELNEEMSKARDNAEQLAQDYKDWFKERNELGKEYNDLVKEESDLRKDVKDAEEELQDLKDDNVPIHAEERRHASHKVSLAEDELEANLDRRDTITDTIDNMRDEKEELEKKIGQTEEVYQNAVNTELQQAEINKRGEEGIRQLAEKLSQEEERIDELRTIRDEQGGLNDDQQEELDKLKDQHQEHKNIFSRIEDIKVAEQDVVGELDNAKENSADIVRLLDVDPTMNLGLGNDKGDAYDINRILSKDQVKRLDIDDNGEVSNLEWRLGRRVTKPLDIKPIMTPWEMTMMNSGLRHGGGTVHELPQYHDGGVTQQNNAVRDMANSMTPPNDNEVDVRLLRNEMVLTKAQQGKLFRMIDTFSELKSNNISESNGGGDTNINVSSLVVREEADIRRISEELERLSKYKNRGKGGR